MSRKLRSYRSYGGYGGHAGLLPGIFSYVSKVTRLQKLRCFSEIFKKILPKVTRFQKLRGFRMASVGDFSTYPQSYEVTEVTEVTQDFFREFPLMSRKLRGYESYDAFQKFSNKIFQKLQGFRSYEGFSWPLLDIFPLFPKVTRFQKLRRFRMASVGNFYSCPQSYKVTEVTEDTHGLCWRKFSKKSHGVKVTYFRKSQCFWNFQQPI